MATEPVRANTQAVDPFSFEDPRFAGVDNRRGKDELFNDFNDIVEDTPEIQEILDAEAEEAAAAIVPVPTPVVTPSPTPVPTPAANEPEVIEYPDGSSVTIYNDKKGWHAELDSNTGGGLEVFHGRTKDEMWRSLAAGKIAATRKIRDLNREVQLGGVRKTDTPAPTTGPIAVREMTADEVFQLKTQLQNNPDLAMQTWFQKKTGMTLEQLVNLANQNPARVAEADAEEDKRVKLEARKFRAAYPEYYPTDTNLQALDDYLKKNDLEWNHENLGEAFETLSEAGLLDIPPQRTSRRTTSTPTPAAPAAPEPTPVAATPAPVTPAPAPAAPAAIPPVEDPRIVGRRRQLRGSGIRQNEITSVPDVSDTPPTAEELDNLSNEEIDQLFSGVRRMRAQSARR